MAALAWCISILQRKAAALGSALTGLQAGAGHTPAAADLGLALLCVLRADLVLGVLLACRLVLASPETATDLDYSRIEGVVGHEYFQ